ncbi:hypothetical protein HPP92_014571 [Vanilla planifolia]|uniref:Uncharacterized protein n=1 Tax=Vanilla planifolia TaxID=51239 RepID=A0A835QR77_VANPL|nr:hypothetical protein HPP92_014571 [Vanilla planifolia]
MPNWPGALHHRRAVIVNVTNKKAAGVALHPGALALDSPLIDRLKEGSDLVLLAESKLGLVHPREGKGSLVPRLEVRIRRIEVRRAQRLRLLVVVL